MINDDAYYSKIQWKEVVWGKDWAAERDNRNYQLLMDRDRYIFDSALGDDEYLSWWILADLRICEIWVCETMAKIVASVHSRLKIDLVRKGVLNCSCLCTLCDLGLMTILFT